MDFIECRGWESRFYESLYGADSAAFQWFSNMADCSSRNINDAIMTRLYTHHQISTIPSFLFFPFLSFQRKKKLRSDHAHHYISSSIISIHTTHHHHHPFRLPKAPNQLSSEPSNTPPSSQTPHTSSHSIRHLLNMTSVSNILHSKILPVTITITLISEER